MSREIKVAFRSRRDHLQAEGYLYGRSRIGSKGVVLLHEWWGVDDHMRLTASKLSASGFVVLIADVFRGEVFETPKAARENISSIDYGKAALDVSAASKYLKRTGCAKVAVVGFGFGAVLALVSASLHVDAFDGVAPNCGVPKPEMADLRLIQCPVQGHYAAKDKAVGISSPLDFHGMAELLWGAGVSLEMCIYDAEHAFTNASYPTYNKKATEEYFANLERFLNETL